MSLIFNKLFSKNTLLFIVIITLLSSIYFPNIQTFPRHDYDEPFVLSIMNRITNYNDSANITNRWVNFSSKSSLSLPHSLSVSLRKILQYLFDFNYNSQRIISAIFILASIILLFLSTLVVFGSKYFSGFFAIIVGLTPGVIQAARTVRFEQDIVLLGVMSVSLPILFVKKLNKSKIAECILWFLAGLCSAWATGYHPWGLVFLVALIMSSTIDSKLWSNDDNLTTLLRLTFLIAGGGIPFFFWVAPFIRDFGQTIAAVKNFSFFYEIVVRMSTEAYLSKGANILLPLFSPETSSRLYSIILYPTHFSSPGSLFGISFNIIFKIFYVIDLTMLLSMAILFLGSRCKKYHSKEANLILLIPILFCFFQLFYRPNNGNYYLYFSLFVASGGVICLFLIIKEFDKIKTIKYIFSVVLVVKLILAVFYAEQFFHYIISNDVKANISLPQKLQAFNILAKKLNILNKNNVYVDVMGWPVGGIHQYSLVHAIQAGKFDENEINVIAFDRNFFNLMLYKFPNFGEKQYSADERNDFVYKLTKNINIGGLIFTASPKISYPNQYIFTNDNKNPLVYVFFDTKQILYESKLLSSNSQNFQLDNIKQTNYYCLGIVSSHEENRVNIDLEFTRNGNSVNSERINCNSIAKGIPCFFLFQGVPNETINIDAIDALTNYNLSVFELVPVPQ